MNHINLDNYSINYQVFFKKIKHMYLRYDDNTIKITCNKAVSQQAIENFIIKHKSWILKHHLLEKIDLYNEDYMYIWGQKYPLVYDENIFDDFLLEDQHILIKDNHFDPKKIEKFYKELILKEVNDIIDNHQHAIGKYIPIKKVTYKAQLMKSRLGSCIASKRIVKVNTLLARLDKKYLKLVLFHELVHLKVSNHSSEFHALLEKVHPDHKYLNKELKKKIRSFVY
ncbi:MAG: M48 family metallopeptidase [Candidatus Izemoplasmatales bacterium]